MLSSYNKIKSYDDFYAIKQFFIQVKDFNDLKKQGHIFALEW